MSIDERAAIDITTIPVYLSLAIVSFLISRRNEHKHFKSFSLFMTFSLIKVVQSMLALIVVASGTSALGTTTKMLSTGALQTLIAAVAGTIDPEPSPKSPLLSLGMRQHISKFLAILKGLIGFSLGSGLLGDLTSFSLPGADSSDTGSGKEISRVSLIVSAVTTCITYLMLGILIFLYWSSRPVFTGFHKKVYPLLASVVIFLLGVRVAYHVAGIVTASEDIKVEDTRTLNEENGPWEVFLGMGWIEEIVIVGCIVAVGWLYVRHVSEDGILLEEMHKTCTCGNCTCGGSGNAVADEGTDGSAEDVEAQSAGVEFVLGSRLKR